MLLPIQEDFLSIPEALQQYQIGRGKLYRWVAQGRLRLYLFDIDGDMPGDDFEPAGPGMVALSQELTNLFTSLALDGQDMNKPSILASVSSGSLPLPLEAELLVLPFEIEAPLAGEPQPPQPASQAPQSETITVGTNTPQTWPELIISSIQRHQKTFGRLPSLNNLIAEWQVDGPVTISGKGSLRRFRLPGDIGLDREQLRHRFNTALNNIRS